MQSKDKREGLTYLTSARRSALRASGRVIEPVSGSSDSETSMFSHTVGASSLSFDGAQGRLPRFADHAHRFRRQ